MRRVWIATAVVAVAFGAGARGEDAAPKAQLKLIQGRKLGYTVERTQRSNWGGGERASTSKVKYQIAVDEVNDNGEAKLSVTYKSLASSREGGESSWSFELAKKPDEPSEVDSGIRKAVAKPISVKIAGGRIAEIAGFPEIEATEGDRAARGRLWRIQRVAGERALRRDLELILASALQGHSLETGKSFQIQREPREGDQQRRRFRSRMGSEIAFKLEGIQKNRAKFSLQAVAPGRPENADAPSFERKDESKGEAVVALRAGVLLRLELEHESEISGEFRGNEFDMKRHSTVKIQRERQGKRRGGGDRKKPEPEQKKDNVKAL